MEQGHLQTIQTALFAILVLIYRPVTVSLVPQELTVKFTRLMPARVALLGTLHFKEAQIAHYARLGTIHNKALLDVSLAKLGPIILR